MASTEKSLETQLAEAGSSILQPPDSVEELLRLLDEVENILSRVEQSPSKSMQTALSPSLKALVADELLKHPDVDVKVAVASCISEITRITAPDAPYDDDQMKDVFQLIVSSFENLSDKSSRSYNKRTLILETVAKVRSCVVMLDLECDGLIVEMFQLFLKAIRDYHPENVFSSMETIMTLVLEESEDISSDLISPILASVKRDNQEFLPIARKLGKKVLQNCAKKLKPCLLQAKNSLGFSLDDYSKVVASICDGTASDDGLNDDNACGEQLTEESKLAGASSDGPAQADENKLAVASPDEEAKEHVTKESETETCTEGDHPDVDRSPKSVMSNGIAETGKEDRMDEDPDSSKNPEHAPQPDQSVEPDDSESGKLLKLESKSEQVSKRNGKKHNSLINSTEPSDSSNVDSEKEAEKTVDHEKTCSKEVHGSPTENPSAEEAVVPETDKEHVQLSSPKALESEATNVASPSPSVSVPDEGRPKKAGRPKKKDSLPQEVAPAVDIDSAKTTDVASDSEVKPKGRSGKKASVKITIEEKTPVLVDNSKNEAETASDSEAKILKQCGIKEAGDDIGDGSSSKNKDGRKRRSRGKAMLDIDVAKATKDDNKELIISPKSTSKSSKDEGNLEETPRTNSKRKRVAGKEKAVDTMVYGGNLVGKKVKVWWPDDQAFYDGVIASFDRISKKHKVFYTDGEEEILNLKKEVWEIVGSESISDGEQATERQSPESTPVMHKKKKAKTNSESSVKQEKMDVSRSEEDSSSKLKGTTKSGRRSRGVNKVDGKSEDHAQKTSGKFVDDSSGMVGKFKDVDGSTPKANSNSKMDIPKSATKSRSKTISRDSPKTPTKDTPKTVTKAKGKASRSGKKSNANGSGTVKSGSVKMKDTDEKEKSSPETVKAPESAKGKSAETSKGKETGGKSGKKRRRSARS